MDVLVVGGGAAGLASAIGAARCGAFVSVLEANKKPAEKILITGGGKCNYTNTNLDTKNYYEDEASKSFLEPILYNFDATDAINFFESLGVYSISRSGYIYPRSEEASAIRDALLKECERLGVKIRNNTKVTKIDVIEENVTAGATKSFAGKTFEVFTDSYSYKTDKVIIATGGKSGAGADALGTGYAIAKSFGHKINPLRPALTGLVLDDDIRKASGTRTQARAVFTYGGINFECSGEIQITSYGISGIPILNISRNLPEKLIKGHKCYINIDFLPEISSENLDQMLSSGITLEGLLPKKLAGLCDVNDPDKHPKSYKALVSGIRDYEYSQVTSGGIDTSEVDPLTMESKLANGIYFAGEILDIDGMCGGYNLHFAWASGVIAGYASAGKAYKHIMPSIDQLRRWEAAEIGSRRDSHE